LRKVNEIARTLMKVSQTYTPIGFHLSDDL